MSMVGDNETGSPVDGDVGIDGADTEIVKTIPVKSTSAKSKPYGAVPPGFDADSDGMMRIGGQRVDALITGAGDTPLFVYDMALVAETIGALRAAMPDQLGIHYAVKANPHPAFLRNVRPLVSGFDVASAGEMTRALEAGMPADAISFAGPGKRDRELEAAIAAGVTLNLESEGEARRALAIGERLGKTPQLAVRVNPDFDLKGSGMRMGGGAKPFGVDAARVPALVREILAAGADWRGLHIFAGSQALDPEAIAETQGATVMLATRIADEAGAQPPVVNLGGGFGVPYFAGDVPLDIKRVGDALEQTFLNSSLAVLGETHFCIELGRYIAAQCGVYLTRVVDVKDSHGERFAVVDGGLHHQLAASGNFGTVIRRNYPIAVANKYVAAPTEITSVVGCLCTPMDRLGDQVLLPAIAVGDMIALFMAGAYGASASPAAFLGHPPAQEIVLDL